jgi:predicted house-cleaning noncanonical NTP pyrophosphatase (MazG superfamily)
MDNFYRCELEVWGSKGILKTNRVFTAPEDFIPEIIVNNNQGEFIKILNSDDAFKKSILHFYETIFNEKVRLDTYSEIKTQAELIEFIRMDNKNGS